MNPLQQLHHAGQSIWLDNITRELLTSKTLSRYIDDIAVTGLTSNPTIFGNAFKSSDAYDQSIAKYLDEGLSGEDLFFQIAIDDLREAADLFRPIWERTHGVDGWVSSLFVSRWDTAVSGKDEGLHNMLGIAMAKKTYQAFRDLLDSARWKRLETEGAKAQRLLWASTGTKDPDASDVLYERALAAPFTINTMPEKTLLAYGDHGDLGNLMPADGGNADEVIQRFRDEDGVDVKALAEQLQAEGAEAFDKSWNELMAGIEEKS